MPSARRRLRLAAGLLLALLAGCPAPEEPSAKTLPVKVGVAIPSYVHAVAWIGEEQGTFSSRGLRTEVQVMGGSAATARALIAGAIDVGIAGGDAVIKANRAGADLVVVGGLVDRFYHRLVVSKDIASADDLRGKSLGLAILGGPQEMAARYGLESLGLDPDEDVKLRSMGREFNRLAALSSGDVQATVTQTPPSRLKELGLRVLVDLPEQDVSFPYAVVVTRRQTLKNDPERVRAFLAGLVEAIELYKDEVNKAACLKILASKLKSTDTRDAVEERYRVSGPGMISWPPRPAEEGFRTVLRFLDVKDVQPADLLDLQLLDEVLGAKR